MKFCPLLDRSPDRGRLEKDYQSGRRIGVLSLGEQSLFFRRMMKVWYIDYADVTRYFRRVQLVPAKLCCGKGDFQIENLVICGDGRELAMVQLPGLRAAEETMKELKIRIPHAKVGKPEEGEAI